MKLPWFSSKKPKRREDVRWVVASIKNEDGSWLGKIMYAEEPPVRKSDYPWRAYVTFTYRNRPLPSREKSEAFIPIDNILEEQDREEYCAWIAVITIEGKRDYILYCRDREESAKRFLAELGPFSPDIEFALDPGWGQFYDFLAMARN